MSVTFASTDELAEALRRAEQAHGRFEQTLGHQDEDWPSWYARFLEQEQTSEGGAASDGSGG
ncbi:hypothetical protein ABZ446_23660 [Streptomyces sp. NPDC005813]|uniref:hypothetical protein n=1 Tax=Streptomyces sp. NPDC005813 TaxID=3155592 RepID=UPI00340AF90C